MSEGQPGTPREKLPLYTWDLTPLREIPDEMWAVVGPILFPEEKERTP